MPTVDFLDIKKYSNISDQIYYSTGSNTDPSVSIVNEHLSEYFLTDNIFVAGKPSNTVWTFDSSENAICKPKDATANCNKMWYFPVERCTNISKIAFDLYIKVEGTMQEWAFCDMAIARIVNGVLTYTAIPNIGNHGSKTYPYSEQWIHHEYNVDVVYMDYLKIACAQSSVKLKNIKITYSPVHIANGGGATHIAKVTGQLKDLSSNLSDILLVSGGGGGGLLVDGVAYEGKDAGGISGSGDNSANQSTGYGFGQGESANSVPCGGGGLYGGYKGSV